jgi:rhamnose utilization protein RhaD (predicted bifunctional aldolase and dehydrogenase)/NAD(P)-dependent dehydrogenase (short-subunit alcohol dehydrogenase family)
MHSLWNDQQAAACSSELDLRVYSSRLLGADPSLVLHGGGNTSVKVVEKNVFGEDEDILYIKGSGWDLATIEAAGFAPVRLGPVRRLVHLPRLSDPEMVKVLQSNLTRGDAPAPSVETILHAVLPHPYVDHTHADSFITLSNSNRGMERVQEVYGDLAVIVPYVMPGFDLAQEAARIFAQEAGPQTLGMVLLHHGVFSFGRTAQESYERMIFLVNRAEEYLQAHGAWQLDPPKRQQKIQCQRNAFAQVRRVLSQHAGRALLLSCTGSPQGLDFARRADVMELSQHGPATPDHVLRTKALPLVGRNVDQYARAYQDFFQSHAAQSPEAKTMLDPAPRVLLDPDWGLCSVGKSAQELAVVADIYEHTITCILRAERLGGWRALPLADLFAVEYWDLEQAKLKNVGKDQIFSGEVVLITGAASGIGRACVQAFLHRGAAVVGLDIQTYSPELTDHPAFLGLTCDIAQADSVQTALDQAVQKFGGLDMLVLNAGVFPASTPLASLSASQWSAVMRVNVDANVDLLRESYPLLQAAPQKGRVVVIGSKNVPAPGPGAAAYSASKAALTQLMRVAALEWAKDGIRINALHPNAVFDTGIWTEEIVQARAAHYGLTVDEYTHKTLLGISVRSQDVAELAAELCGPLFSCTTAAQIPVDGGNERVV